MMRQHWPQTRRRKHRRPHHGIWDRSSLAQILTTLMAKAATAVAGMLVDAPLWSKKSTWKLLDQRLELDLARFLPPQPSLVWKRGDSRNGPNHISISKLSTGFHNPAPHDDTGSCSYSFHGPSNQVPPFFPRLSTNLPSPSNSTPSPFNRSNFILWLIPLGAFSQSPLKPPTYPFAAMTRWHGTSGAKGLLRRAPPTARGDVSSTLASRA